MRRVFVIAFTLAFLGVGVQALADVPTEMAVQGRLTNAANAPVPPGLKNFTFKIFDAPSGGAEIWPGGPGETQLLTTDANGLWNAGVGTVIPLTEAVFLSPIRWLEVTVDDGVNPIETLPRLELRTTPYAYRAATSQQADSLAGSSLSDLVDQFVDEEGDGMTGPLTVDWQHLNLGASIAVDNHNNSWTPYWSDDFGYGNWGLSADVNGDGNNFNVGVAGAARGNDNTVEGNYALLGYADGNVTNIGVLASTSNLGTSNYSGYFSGGDFSVQVPFTPGTLGVMLPPDAIDNSEIADESGIAFDNSILAFSLLPSNTGQDISRVSLTTPASGYVVVTATVVVRFSGTTSSSYAWINLDVSGTDNSLFNSTWHWAGADAHAGTGNEYQTLTATRVFSVSAGVNTFEVIGNGWDENAVGASVNVWTSNILATYQPTGYGTVDALVADASGFEHSTAVRLEGGLPQTGGTTLYEVDLRELELKAARAQAEAERARRELVEAKLGALSAGVRSAAGEQK